MKDFAPVPSICYIYVVLEKTNYNKNISPSTYTLFFSLITIVLCLAVISCNETSSGQNQSVLKSERNDDDKAVLDPALSQFIESFKDARTPKALESPKHLNALHDFSERAQIFRLSDSMSLFFPFSGNDFFNTFHFFPNCQNYILASAEMLGQIPNQKKADKKQKENFMLKLAENADPYKSQNTNTHSEMVSEILLQLHWIDARVLNLKYLDLDPFGNPIELGNKDPEQTAQAFQITFESPLDLSTKNLFYFSHDLSNNQLINDLRLVHFLNNHENKIVYLKSDKQKIAGEAFTILKEQLLDQGSIILQDSKGIAFEDIGDDWEVNVFGDFSKAESKDKNLKEFVAKQKIITDLNFEYFDHLLFAQKKTFKENKKPTSLSWAKWKSNTEKNLSEQVVKTNNPEKTKDVQEVIAQVKPEPINKGKTAIKMEKAKTQKTPELAQPKEENQSAKTKEIRPKEAAKVASALQSKAKAKAKAIVKPNAAGKVKWETFKNQYIIKCAQPKTKEKAEAEFISLKKLGLPCEMIWIPDEKIFGKNQRYLIFAGPFKNESTAKSKLRTIKNTFSRAYIRRLD